VGTHEDEGREGAVVSDIYTKDELVKLATTHHDQAVRACAAESLYTRGVKDGGAQIIAARQRALDVPTTTNLQVPG
jgi:hypothetical protein